jgi:formate dehydrogenase maturation protein FdhE
MTPMPEISVARTPSTADPEAFKSRLLAYCNEAARLFPACIQMRQKLNGQGILQVTRAQCPACGAREVFSVLVAESTGACGRNGGRAFHTCNRTLSAHGPEPLKGLS